MKHLLPSLLLLLLPALPLRAAEEDPTQKLREQLRSVLLQLRTAQTESANHQALAAQAEQKTKDLATKLEDLEKRNATLIRQAAADKTAADQTIATLNNKLAARDKSLTDHKQALEKWKAGYQTAATAARTKEDERAKLHQETLLLKRTLADRETKNLALFNTSLEILDRFQNYSLGKALAAREPFIGAARVKIETLVEGYKDKILDNRISATATPAATPAAAAKN